jgi:iron complex outermembrane recepter protein
MKKHRHLLLVGAAALCFGTPALAQDKPAETPETPVATGAETPKSDDTPVDVVVTADRREQSLQNYAGTAAVLSPDALLKVGINNIENLNDALPGLRVQNFGGAVDIALRGIGTNQNTELGDPNVATHFDDVYVPRVQGLANSYFDLKSVEVNFGPQGTLRGRNASSGSLNFISWAPELGKFRATLEGSWGNFDQQSIRGVINVPFGDKVALRISGSFDRHGSYYRNVGAFPNVTAPYADENRGIRAQLLFQPTDRLSILIAGDYNFQNSTGFNGSNFSTFLGFGDGFLNAANTVRNPRDVLTGPLGEEYYTEHGGIRGKITYTTDGLFNVQYIGSHRDLRFGGDGAGPAGVAYPGFETGIPGVAGFEQGFYNGPAGRERADNFSRGIARNFSLSDYHELRFFNDTEPFKYSLGGNYFNERQRTFSSSVADNNAFFQGQEFNTRTQSEAYAFYGDATYSLTKRLRLTAGVRYTNDSKSRTGVISRLFFGGGAADFNCCGSFRLGTEGFQFNTERTIFNPDLNNDNIISSGEQLTFFLDGVRRFGARDTIPIAFGPAIAALQANPALVSDPNFGIPAGPGCYNSALTTYYVCRADGQYTYNFVAHTINNQGARINTNFVDWRARVEYDLTDDNLVYGLVSRGHKAASFNDNLGPLGPAPFFRPEEVTLFEIGTKNEFTVFGRKAILNLSGFYNDYRDQQLTALLGVQSIINQIRRPDGTLIDVTGPQTVPNGFNQNQVVAFTYNAANSETYGIQGSGSIILPGRFKFGADFLWLEGRVKNADPVQDFRFQADVNGLDSVARPIQGNRLPYTPRFQINASLAQVIPVGGRLGGTFDWLVSVSWRSSSFATIFNSQDFAFLNREVFPQGDPRAGQIRVPSPRGFLEDRIPSYYLVNIAAGYTFGEVRVEAYVNNLFDNTVAAGLLVSQFSNTRFFTNPRLIGGRIRVNF